MAAANDFLTRVWISTCADILGADPLASNTRRAASWFAVRGLFSTKILRAASA